MKTKCTKQLQLILTSILTIMMAVALFGCGGSGNSSDSDSTDEGNGSENASTSDEITFGTPFEFDNLTITFGSGVVTTVLENEFSDHNGASIAVVPMTIVNNSDETHGLNMFYFKAYGPDGTQLDDISAYFMENDVTFAGDTRSGATLETSMHILYTGPGDYFVEFSMPASSNKIEVRLPLDL